MPAYIPGKLIYLFHAHTGSRSTLEALQKVGAQDVKGISKKENELKLTDHHGVFEKQSKLKLTELIDVSGKQKKLKLTELIDVFEKQNEHEITISTIRNPYEYVLSWWRHTSRPGTPVGFLEEIAPASRHFQQDGRLFYHADKTDIFVNFSYLSEGVRIVCQDYLGKDPGDLPIIGRSKRQLNDKDEKWIEQIKSIVDKEYPQDVELWEKISGEILARQTCDSQRRIFSEKLP